MVGDTYFVYVFVHVMYVVISEELSSPAFPV